MSLRPNYGLVCVTSDGRCSFRTITRTRFLALNDAQQRETLRDLYWDNLARLHQAISYCARRDIHLYRMISSLFPMSDEPLGEQVLRSMIANLSAIGRRAKRLKMRIVMHPDQFVVLNSESPNVVQTSITILEKQAMWMDLMGLPRSPWSALIIHGGKSGRADELVKTIRSLPVAVRKRLCLENDEYAYSARQILDVCRRAKVPMIFDNLHHAVREQLVDYSHRSFATSVSAARSTWPNPAWQLVHLSNGSAGMRDRNHSEWIESVPRAYRNVPWIEVEARGKERAIERLMNAAEVRPVAERRRSPAE